jgi:alkylresorcinol/alkylpyrone synthase
MLFVAKLMLLKPSAFMLDLVGQGCGAAIPSLRAGAHRHQSLLLRLIYPSAASGIIAANPDAVVAVCCVEICRCASFLIFVFN